jgi:hypothetical protein
LVHIYIKYGAPPLQRPAGCCCWWKLFSSSSEYTQQLNTHCRQNALFLNVKAVLHVVIKVYFGSFINHPQQATCKHFSGDTDKLIKT